MVSPTKASTMTHSQFHGVVIPTAPMAPTERYARLQTKLNNSRKTPPGVQLRSRQAAILAEATIEIGQRVISAMTLAPCTAGATSATWVPRCAVAIGRAGRATRGSVAWTVPFHSRASDSGLGFVPTEHVS